MNADSKKAPSPARHKARQRDEAASFSAPRYHPVSTPETGRLSNAVTGRNRSVLIKPRLFAQTAQERTSAQSVSEALSAGGASLFADPLVPTLSVAAFRVFRFYNQLLCYHNSRPFASADVFFAVRTALLCRLRSKQPVLLQNRLFLSFPVRGLFPENMLLNGCQRWDMQRSHRSSSETAPDS